MDSKLQIILIISSLLFFIYIFNMIQRRKIEVKFTLIWMGSSVGLIILAVFPNIIENLARVLYIKDPANALFLVIIAFLVVIVFSLSIAISKAYEKIKDLTQEFGILKLKVLKMHALKKEDDIHVRK